MIDPIEARRDRVVMGGEVYDRVHTVTLHQGLAALGGVTLKQGGWYAWRNHSAGKTWTGTGRPLAAIAARELFGDDGANAVLRLLAMVAA